MWKGFRWAVTLLAMCSLAAAGVIASGGIPPWGPVFGGLAFIAALQALLLCAYDLGPNSDPGGARSPVRRAAKSA